MKQKNIISLAVAFAFLALSITGILLFVKQKAHFVEITHTIFGLTFVGFAIFHIINNWSSIVGYSKERKTGKFQKELIIAASVFGVLLVGGLTEFLEPVAEAGKVFAPARPPRPEQLTFNSISTKKELSGTALNLMIQKNKETELPIIAIWVEDSVHNFVENLFVPAKIASMPTNEEEAREGKFEMSDFKPESLSTWSAKAKIKTANFDQETPHENFVLKTNTSVKGQFYVMLEIKGKDKTELYEASINKTNGEVFKLKSKDNSLIMSGLVEL